nr:MAG TPA: hypothetical protein [Caudoviricetes sp.]
MPNHYLLKKKHILINCLFSACRINDDAWRNGRRFASLFRIPPLPFSVVCTSSNS